MQYQSATGNRTDGTGAKGATGSTGAQGATGSRCSRSKKGCRTIQNNFNPSLTTGASGTVI